MNRIIRRFLPLGIRQDIRHRYRQLVDLMHGTKFDHSKGVLRMSQPIGITQPIMPSSSYANKIINITRGVALVNQSLIGANQYWSFWHRIKCPNAANGFVNGRNLVNGQLVSQTGGGLCQLSSIIYHLALLGGLTIVERHAHSIDIYEEDQRFTPLGSDATVVWGFKDLRLHNPHPFPVSLEFWVEQGQLIGELNAGRELTFQQVNFVRVPLDGSFVKVNTVINNMIQATTIYEQKQGLQVTHI